MSSRGGGGSGRRPAGRAGTRTTAPSESIHERSARLQREGGLAREVRPEEEQLQPIRTPGVGKETALHIIDPYHIASIYGEEHVGAVLSRVSRGGLAQAAQVAGVKMARTNAETVSRITAHVTQGRYSANFGHSGGSRSGGDRVAAKSAELRPLETHESRIEGYRSGIASAKAEIERISSPRYGMPQDMKAQAIARLQANIRVNEGLIRAETEVAARERSSSAKGEGETKAAKAEKPAETESMHERSARLQREQGLAREVRPEEAGPHGERLIARQEGRNSMTGALAGTREANPGAAPDAHYLVRIYGEHQLGAALSRYGMKDLKQAAELVGVKPGSSKADTVSRITVHVTGGRYSANFGATKAATGAGRRSSSGGGGDRHATRYETQIAKLEQQLAAKRAEYEQYKQTGQVPAAKSST